MQAKRYCTNCGAEVRSGTAFCVYCGMDLAPQTGDTTYIQSPPSSVRGSFVGGLRASLLSAIGWLQRSFSGLRAHDLRRVAPGVRRRFGRLPLAGKVGLVGLVLLVAFTVLSPVFAVVAAVALVTSLIAVVVRLVQRRSVVRWGIGAGAALVLALFLSGVAGIVYGGGNSIVGDSGEQGPTPQGGGSQQGPPAYGDVAQGTESIADSWAASDIDSPLFVPSQLPSPPSDVGHNISDSGFNSPIYLISGWNYDLTLSLAGHPGNSSYSAGAPGVQTLTTDDGRSYYFIVERDDPYYGAYSVAFWDDGTFVYRLETSEVSVFTQEQFIRLLESMVRIESRASV